MKLQFEAVHKSFGDHEVLRGVSFGVAAGSVHFVIGASGAGKSVLIKQLVGLLRPDSGRILIDGTDVTRLRESEFFDIRRRCQMIFQHATLFDALTVLENVATPVRKRFGVNSLAAVKRAHRALEKVGVRDLAARFPAQLGAGVRKRVAIARALALEPEVLLYDEPTTSLDPVAARRTDRLIRHNADAFGLTSIVVSHDLRSVRDIGDRVTYLHAGTIHFDGAPAQLFASTDPVIHRFVHGVRERWEPVVAPSSRGAG